MKELGKEGELVVEASNLARKDWSLAVGRVYELLKLEEQLPDLEARIVKLEMLVPARDAKGRFAPKSLKDIKE